MRQARNDADQATSQKAAPETVPSAEDGRGVAGSVQPMKSGHRYSAAGLQRLQVITGSSDPVLLALEVSSGPWPSFNGVQTLVLTKTTLYRLQTTRFALRRNAVLDVLNRGEISGATWNVGPLGRLGRLRFTGDGRRRAFVSAWADGAEFVSALRLATPSS